MILQLILVGAAALVAGVSGWRISTRMSRRVSFYDNRPLGMSETHYRQRQQVKAGLRRSSISLLCAIAASAVTWLIITLIARVPS
jgi:hypothetical protein